MASVKRNNPGNIRKGQPWRGLAETQDESGFDTFIDSEHGIRAMMLILNSYAKRKINTVKDIIKTWAPPNENDTDAYIADVSARMGIKPTDVMIYPGRGVLKMDGSVTKPANKTFANDKGTMVNLVKAIIQHENGIQPYGQDMFDRAWVLAGL